MIGSIANTPKSPEIETEVPASSVPSKAPSPTQKPTSEKAPAEASENSTGKAAVALPFGNDEAKPDLKEEMAKQNLKLAEQESEGLKIVGDNTATAGKVTSTVGAAVTCIPFVGWILGPIISAIGSGVSMAGENMKSQGDMRIADAQSVNGQATLEASAKV